MADQNAQVENGTDRLKACPFCQAEPHPMQNDDGYASGERLPA